MVLICDAVRVHESKTGIGMWLDAVEISLLTILNESAVHAGQLPSGARCKGKTRGWHLAVLISSVLHPLAIMGVLDALKRRLGKVITAPEVSISDQQQCRPMGAQIRP